MQISLVVGAFSLKQFELHLRSRFKKKSSSVNSISIKISIEFFIELIQIGLALATCKT